MYILICIYVNIFVDLYIYVYTCTHMYLNIYTCIYLHISPCHSLPARHLWLFGEVVVDFCHAKQRV